MTGDALSTVYGEDTLNYRSKYATPATLLLRQAASTGSAIFTKRLVDPAAKQARIRIGVEVVEDQIPVYQRNTDGSFKIDTDGKKIPAADGSTVTGYKLKWVVNHDATAGNPAAFGKDTKVVGSMMASDGTTQADYIPVLDALVSWKVRKAPTSVCVWTLQPPKAATRPVVISLSRSVLSYIASSSLSVPPRV